MNSRRDTWKFITAISRICLYGGIPSFFYFFGYRINGNFQIVYDNLPFHNPFLYINLIAVFLGLFVLVLSFYAKQNDYRINGTVLLNTFIRIGIVFLFIILIRSFIYD